MSRNGTLQVFALIVCYCVCTILPVKPFTLPQDKPVIYPDALEDNRSNQIPESILIQMSEIKNYSQLLDFLGVPDYGIANGRPIKPNGEPDDYNITAEGGRRGLAGGGMDIARTAACEPELQTVELDKPIDSTHVYWPMCIRVTRCGGCCTSSLLTCVPVKTTTVKAKVLHAQYLSGDQGGQFEVMGFKSLDVERHEQCSCKCVQREEDCTTLQKYKSEECRCMCTDVQAMQSCTGSRWIWDPKECACKCRIFEECSTGFFFNGISCRCESQRASLVGRRNFDSYNSSSPVRYELGLNTSQESVVQSYPTKQQTTVSPTTTTTPTPVVLGRRGRIGVPVGEQVKYRTPVNVGIRPSDDDDGLAPFTSARSKDTKESRKIQFPTTSLDNKGTTLKTLT